MGERPRLWRRDVITWGLFSRGTKVLRFCCVGALTVVLAGSLVVGVVSAMVALVEVR